MLSMVQSVGMYYSSCRRLPLHDYPETIGRLMPYWFEEFAQQHD